LNSFGGDEVLDGGNDTEDGHDENASYHHVRFIVDAEGRWRVLVVLDDDDDWSEDDDE